MIQRDVTVDVGGQAYRLVLNTNVLIGLETKTGQPFGEIMALCGKGQLGAMRALYWAALATHHPGMSMEQVGEWMDQAGQVTLVEAARDLSATTHPDPSDVEELGLKPKRPRKARAA